MLGFYMKVKNDGVVTGERLKECMDFFAECVDECVAEVKAKHEQELSAVQEENKELRRRVEYLERLSRGPRARV